MRFFRPWPVAKLLYPQALFRINTRENEVCLTFDDGPDPASTPAILESLARYNVKAIFFCTGAKAEKYPVLVKRLKDSGHIVGNHGYFHPDGFRTSLKNYVDDIHKADQFISSSLFRPPYGRITPWQYNALKKQYRIFFWDLMPYDFDPSFGPEKSLCVLKTKIRPGSVVVLHDNHLSCAGQILDEFIAYCIDAGFTLTVEISN